MAPLTDNLLHATSSATWLLQNSLEKGDGTLDRQDTACGLFCHLITPKMLGEGI